MQIKIFIQTYAIRLMNLKIMLCNVEIENQFRKSREMCFMRSRINWKNYIRQSMIIILEIRSDIKVVKNDERLVDIPFQVNHLHGQT